MRTSAIAQLLWLLPSMAGAQTVRGVVVDPADRPVAGVVMVLLDAQSTSAARALSNDRGEFRLTASTDGVYRVRTTRIGFRPLTSEPLSLRAGQDVVKRLALSAVPVSLDTLRSNDRSPCRLLGRDSAATTWAVWEQIRAALTAAQLTAGSGQIAATTLAFERRFDSTAASMGPPTGNVLTAVVTEPWRAISADSLRRVGYVVAEAGDTAKFHVPDLQVLLSTEFVEDHCLRLVDSPDSTRLGVVFEPTSDRRRIPEIVGTLWVDRRSSELRGLEFRYVNVAADVEKIAGGEMHFVRMRHGGWAISRWLIRMPVFEYPPAVRRIRRPPVLVETRINGGSLVVAASLDKRDTLWATGPVTIHGVAYDSVHGVPLIGALLELAGSARMTMSDSSGRFAFDNLMPGVHAVVMQHDLLDSIGVSAARAVAVVVEARDTVRIAVPSMETIWRVACGRAPPAGDSGLVYGTVRGVGRRRPLAEATIAARWSDVVFDRKQGFAEKSWELDATSDSTGSYALCGVPTATGIRMRAATDSAASGFIDLMPFDRLRIKRQDLLLGPGLTPDSSSQGVIAGLVTGSNGSPLVDARVTLYGLAEARTGADGRFILRGMPTGTQQIEALAIGLQPVIAVVDVTPLDTARVDLQLLKMTTLDAMNIIEPSVRQKLVKQFEERRRSGWGEFRDSTTIARHGSVSSIFAGIPSVVIKDGVPWLPNKVFGCPANLVVDRIKTDAELFLLLRPADIAAIEVYKRYFDVPVEFQAGGLELLRCGTVVVWTKRLWP